MGIAHEVAAKLRTFVTESAVKICEDCAKAANRGLCHFCASRDRSLLPQLAVPPYVRLIANARPVTKPAAVAETATLPPVNTPGRKLARLKLALGGQFTRSKALA